MIAPRPRGLYNPRFEHDACGMGFVADSSGRPSHAIVEAALEALGRVRHRGAVGADHRSGDGAGVLLPLPARFFAALIEPRAAAGPVGVAALFLPTDPGTRAPQLGSHIHAIVESACQAEDVAVVGWRSAPVDLEALGTQARVSAPVIQHAILGSAVGVDGDELERRCFRARKRIEREAVSRGLAVYVASISFRTITYKAMCAADQLAAFYADLRDPVFEAAFCIFHLRYSTNTAPSWERAQPFRFLCHNGEINTIQGNVNWMRAREGRLGTGTLAPEDLLRPVIDQTGSDSAMLDNALELLVRGGRDIRHALAMLIPEAWEGFDVDPAVRDFYRYHAALMEPWDGPAALIFTDGERVGALLDRNGLRPLRTAVCEDGLVACASEAGAVEVSGHGRVRRGKLGPGEMFWCRPVVGWGAGRPDDQGRAGRAAALRTLGGGPPHPIRRR